MSPRWQIFLCYRQVDGASAAFWAFEHLEGRRVTAAAVEDASQPELTVYFDQAAPAAPNWREVHQPALEASRALVVICTPGLASRLPGQDWVHAEIEWWLANRRAAPILLDTTGDERWIPQSIHQRWPLAQRLRLDLQGLESMDVEQRAVRAELLIERLISGIAGSEATVRREDLEREKLLVRRLRRQRRFTFVALFIVLALAAVVGLLGRVAMVRRAETNHVLALTLLRNAENAWAQDDELMARALSARAGALDAGAEVRTRSTALTAWMDGQREEARDALAGLVESAHRRLVETSRAPHRIERYAGATESRHLFEAWLKLTGELNESAYETVLKWKGLVSRVEQSVRKGVRESNQPPESTKLLAQAEANLAHAVYLGSWNEQRSSARAMAEVNLALAARTKPISGAPGLGSGDWRIIERELRHDEALVDYVRYREQYDAWVLQREHLPVRVPLGSAADIDAAAARFKTWSTSWTGTASRGLMMLTQDTRDTPEESGASLRRLVWEPVKAKLGVGIARVYLSPDGALATVPLAALPGDEQGTILWDEREFVWIASAWDLTQRSAANGASVRSLLVAPVDYSWSYFQRLAGTQEEVQGVAQLLGTGVAQVLLGAQATERNVRQSIRGSRIVHFATHAWTAGPLKLVPVARQSRGVDVGGPITDRAQSMPDQENVDAYLVGLDPMLGTGIALRGLSDTADGMDDGILTGLEISGLPLDGVELVVISGCDTAGTVRDGVGLIGLVQAVREAGAYTVLASLHAVPDEPTAELMKNFYRVALEARMNYPVALRRAALDLRRKGGAPAEWTGFVLYGAAR